MRITKSILLPVAGLLLALQVASPAAELPAPVERGLTAFKTNGGRSAVETWCRGGPLESTEVEKAEVKAVRELQKLYGDSVDSA